MLLKVSTFSLSGARFIPESAKCIFMIYPRPPASNAISQSRNRLLEYTGVPSFLCPTSLRFKDGNFILSLHSVIYVLKIPMLLNEVLLKFSSHPSLCSYLTNRMVVTVRTEGFTSWPYICLPAYIN